MAAAVADLTVTAENVGASGESKVLQAIRYSRGKLELLDQRKLPHESIYLDIPTTEAAWHAIKDMVVRGAPAIAIAAALALAVEVHQHSVFESADAAVKHITDRLDYLVSSRPTAVNLSDAAEKLKKVAEDAAKEEPTPEAVVLATVLAAEAMLSDDVAANKRIGAFGAQAMVEALRQKGVEGKNLRVLTHCNTGSLATAAYGTALGVIRSLHAQGLLETAVCTETRPYNQGSRLTAFELTHDGIPALLIADSAAASLKAAGRIDAVVVGADRIAANGDTANKIGTYSLALSAFHHKMPFFVAAPLTSIDAAIKTGEEIVVEERHAAELTHSLGGAGPQTGEEEMVEERHAAELTHSLGGAGPQLNLLTVGLSALFPCAAVPCAAVPCAAVLCGDVPCGDVPCGDVPCGDVPCGDVPCGDVPCGDVPCGDVPCGAVPCGDVPCAAVPCGDVPCGDVPCAAVPCGDGVIWKKEGASVFDIRGFLHSLGAPVPSSPMYPPPANNPHPKEDDAQPHDPHKDRIRKDALEASRFTPVSEHTVPAFLQDHPDLAARLGGGPDQWSVREVGDGNINFVYIVEGPGGALVVKQALPYVRVVGESWPMTLDRIYYEALALRQQFAWVPELVPEVYFFSHPMALLVMRYVAPPAIVLRKGLVQGRVYPLLAEHMSSFLASTLFLSSLIAINTEVYRDKVREFCGNVEMCRLTEQVIFTEPYVLATNNRWTTPQLDDDAAALREDVELKLSITELKSKFCERAQALLHADLHTGSVMVTEESTVVIDPEFAFYGPMGFDIGAFLANLLLAYFSQDGHATADDSRAATKKWILQCFTETWQKFEAKFLALWNDKALAKGDAYPQALYHDNAALLSAAQTAFLREVFLDSLGFAGAKMVRRIVGIAHVEDLESIADPDVRAACERRALNFGKHLIKERQKYNSIAEVAAAVEAIV
ncbi:unnamed protein product [Closterium sp. NIES-65]|nr:unnamed protein product [Closterium sp. NIES-65]